MNRSASQCVIGSNRRGNEVSKRCVYINEEMPRKTEKKEVQTIFHSPYKDGRPNKNFCNPTFMSSDIISNRQFSPFNPCTPKKAIVHTQAQNKQRALYNQRMNRSQSFKNIGQRIRQTSKSLQKKAKERSAQRANQGKNSTMIMNSTLQKELQTLLKFRQQRELKQYNRDPHERVFRKTIKKQSEVPVYFQKVYKNPHYVEQQEQKKRGELKEWMGLSKELELIKQQIKKEKNREQVNNMRRNIENNQAQAQEKEFINRRNAQLLNRVLLQQIRTKERESAQQKRERGWRVF